MLRNYYLSSNGVHIYQCIIRKRGAKYEIAKIVKLKYGLIPFEFIKDNDLSDGFISKDLYPLAVNSGGDCYYWRKETEEVFVVYNDSKENPILV